MAYEWLDDTTRPRSLLKSDLIQFGEHAVDGAMESITVPFLRIHGVHCVPSHIGQMNTSAL